MDTLELKATGEKTVFIEDNPGRLEIIIHHPAGQSGPPKHKHTFQVEYFEIMEGRMGFISNDRKHILQQGESLTVPANTYHTYFPVDKFPVKLKVVFKPAMRMSYFLRETYACANHRRSEEPSWMERCYLVDQMKGEYFDHNLPVIFQKRLYPLITHVGKLLGFIKARPYS